MGFKPAVMTRNRARVERFVNLHQIEATKQFVSKILNWESKNNSLASLILFVICAWLFELWMIPFALICVLLKDGITKFVTGKWANDMTDIQEIPDTQLEVGLVLSIVVK